MKSGGLYLVATPIGNLEDITLRAIKVLKQVDLIAAEDTRHAAILLRKYAIETPLVSYYEQNEERRSRELLERLIQGQQIALISDAGTPLLSDPGYRLVQKALANDIQVVPIPGASALLAGLTASGLPVNRFVFEGFMPKKKGRQTLLKKLAEEERTVVIYESPFRLIATLKDLQINLGNRQCVCARELTKLHEEYVRGTIAEVLEHFSQHSPRGEFVIIVAGKEKA